ncbi:MAG: DUF1801 domain-containing protein [Phycisphaerales bacterium]|nr:DUF1801 domain-containing protein [Phycisphaerales bacterium]
MQSKATTVAQYLKELPEDRRAAIEAVRAVILKNLDKDYAEGMSYGMIGYYVPHSVYPAGYHCDTSKPLPFAALASQKNYMSVYLMSVYCNCDGGTPTGVPEDLHSRWFQEAWLATGRKLDMGKCCIRFKRLEDVALDVVGEAIRRMPARNFIEYYERAIRTSNTAAAARRGVEGGAPAPKANPSARKGSAKRVGTKKVAKQAGTKKASAKKAGTKKTAGRRVTKKAAAKKRRGGG